MFKKVIFATAVCAVALGIVFRAFAFTSRISAVWSKPAGLSSKPAPPFKPAAAHRSCFVSAAKCWANAQHRV